MGLKTPEKRENTSSNENVFRGLYPVHTYFHFPSAQLFTFSSAYLLIYIILCILIYIFSQHTYICNYIFLRHSYLHFPLAYIYNFPYSICILGVSLAYFLKLSLRLCTYSIYTVQYCTVHCPSATGSTFFPQHTFSDFHLASHLHLHFYP